MDEDNRPAEMLVFAILFAIFIVLVCVAVFSDYTILHFIDWIKS